MTKRKQTVKVLEEALQNLNERVKELNCLCGIANIVTTADMTVDKVCREVVNMLPSSWQYTEVTCARITIGDKEFKTKNFETTEWQQSADIIAEGCKEGTLEVCYLEARPEIGEGPFLKEERLLIEAVAEMLGEVIEHKRVEDEIRKLARFPSENPNPILQVARDGVIVYANQASLPILNTWGCKIGQRLPDYWLKLIQDALNSGVRKEREVKCGDHIFSLTLAPIADANYLNLYGLDITKRKRLSDNMQFYIAEITKAQEEERKRISRELHDETAQTLGRMGLEIDSLIRTKEQLSEEMVRRLEDLRSQVGETLEGLRRLSQNLRPMILDELGLTEALQSLAADVEARKGIEVSLKIQGTPRQLSPEVELILFRIVQESLRNVLRHSQASRCEITLEFDERKMNITISDKGKGFELPQTIGDLAREGKLGLLGIHERAQQIGATLTVETRLGKGSSITVELPT